MSETLLSYAVTDPSGIVVGSTPCAVNGRHAQGAPIPDAQGQADYLSTWAPQPGQTVHVWVGGEPVEATLGGTLDGLRPADASAVRS